MIGRFACATQAATCRRSRLVGDAAIETLRGEDAEFGFGQVEPGAVFGRVAPFEAFDQAPGLGGGIGLVKRCGGVSVEIILDENDRLGFGEVGIG